MWRTACSDCESKAGSRHTLTSLLFRWSSAKLELLFPPLLGWLLLLLLLLWKLLIPPPPECDRVCWDEEAEEETPL